ncbi:LuxR C-terminal-related transcriptional regulator [Aliamphritea spongicola]|nr:LuxR C-terminal-related transcriptional regulator [Aliamphritea spongicola]
MQIADQLNIKPVTVEFHLANVRNKLEAKTREQALVTAIMQGLMEPAFH